MHLQIYDQGKLHVLDLESQALPILRGQIEVRMTGDRPEIRFVCSHLPDGFVVSDESSSDFDCAMKFRGWRPLTGRDTTLVTYQGELRQEARIIVQEDVDLQKDPDDDCPF